MSVERKPALRRIIQLQQELPGKSGTCLYLYVNTRKSILGSQTLESLLLCLKVISEVSIVQCVHCEYMDTFPISAYAALALHASLQDVSSNKNDTTDSAGSTLEASDISPYPKF
ncbi:hypothetical protein M0R45_031777 [Rubus argutus]|uniref:Cyclin C-terminal domain-containing protein n=1 Tax=Rubus argutus TaxID=59490 RepID=A0AAW1WIA1_RUBAR